MKPRILLISIFLLSSCGMENEELDNSLASSVADVNISQLCASKGWVGQYNKWKQDDFIITCYETLNNGEIISKVEFLKY